MRIALYTPNGYYTRNEESIPSGLHVYTRGLARALVKEGHSVSVITHQDNAIGQPRYEFEGSDVHMIPARESRWAQAEDVHAFLTSHPHDVIESHHLDHPLIIEQMIGGTPTVTRHASDFLDSVSSGTYEFWFKDRTYPTARHAAWSQHMAEMTQVRNSDLVTTAGHKQYQKSRRLGISNVLELPLGINEVDDKISTDRDRVFIMIARLHDPRKGGEFLLQLVNSIPEERRVTVLAECEADEASNFKLTALRDFEFLHEPVTDAELAELYRTAALTIVPTKSESFGLVLLEPMARGSFVATWDPNDSSKSTWPLWNLGSHLNPGPAIQKMSDMTEMAFDPASGFREKLRDFAAGYLWQNIVERYERAYDAAIARSIGKGRTRGL